MSSLGVPEVNYHITDPSVTKGKNGADRVYLSKNCSCWPVMKLESQKTLQR